MNCIVLIGSPGCGKGTQAKNICDEFQYIHYSTGDILRQEIRNETELGIKAKNIIAEGKLVGDDIINDMIKQKIKQKYITNILLDGYPRTLNQLNFLQNNIKKQNNIDKILYIFMEIENKEVIRRITNRLLCDQCAKIYRAEDYQVDSICIDEKCDGKLIKRNDDKTEIVQKRLKIYDQEVLTLKNEIIKQKLDFVSVEAKNSIENVKQNMFEIIKNI